MARDLITLNSHINQHKQITKKCENVGYIKCKMVLTYKFAKKQNLKQRL